MGNHQGHSSHHHHHHGPNRSHHSGIDTVMSRFIGRKVDRCDNKLRKKASKYLGSDNNNENQRVILNPNSRQGVLVTVVPQNQIHQYSQPPAQPQPYIQPQPQQRPQSQQQSRPQPPQPRPQTANSSAANSRGLYGDTSNGGEDIQAVCRYCSDNIIPEYYSDHMKYCQHNPQNIKTPCEYCGEKFDLAMLHVHMQNCDARLENIKFKCEHCNQQIPLISYNYHVVGCNKNLQFAPSIRMKPQNLAASQINQVPECAICLLEMKDRTKIRFLGCAHKFHQDCIEDWSKKSKTCPVCVTPFE